MIRAEIQTSVTVEKSVLLNGANIIAAQRFTVPEWRFLALVLVPPPSYRRAYRPRSFIMNAYFSSETAIMHGY